MEFNFLMIEERSMNILCYRYGSIVEPDIIDGFKELGNQVSEICLEIYNKTQLRSKD